MVAAFSELYGAAGDLGEAVKAAWPDVAAPRSPRRCITPTLYLSWTYNAKEVAKLARHKASNLDTKETVGLVYYRRTLVRVMDFKPETQYERVTRPLWLKYLAGYLRSPRLVVRTLARVDSYTRWFQARTRGVYKAVENKVETQKVWTDRLLARHTILEMGSEKPVSWLSNGHTKLTKEEYDIGQRNKISAIKLVRERVPIGLREAKNALEYALTIPRSQYFQEDYLGG
jgi:ribosomal protein L7/L12